MAKCKTEGCKNQAKPDSAYCGACAARRAAERDKIIKGLARPVVRAILKGLGWH